MMQYFPYLLVALGASSRLLPHAPNFAPIAALALFGAVYLKKRDGLWVPLAALAFSDLFIGFYHPLVMASVYGSFLLSGLIGIWLRRRRVMINTPTPILPLSRGRDEQKTSPLVRGEKQEGGVFGRWWPRVFGASLLGSILFFLITNWAVWAFGELYTKDLGGLLMSYTMGLPFFRNTLLGDLFYVAVFFGIAEFVPFMLKQRAFKKSAVLYYSNRSQSRSKRSE